ncbi:PREDICTED: rho GTPase-activating protein 7-like isoform X2 [Amphimedon queenslandica]|uniref:Rho-GAP domain-containing protein n=1 Tax=Amphimedon queenslandica TaxID=400682 RepID=A0A1X7V3A2_AMPQE|nr:PREDICTED: rho GTPase-activating protein 7-like isoform X2 [Amphimedon queenslandica]|eukprot:XP_019850855.1 PREDICTED: rho GTPase-activating protein 7-like isoform X2 [Amphimedon queenslandica]
MMSSKRSLGNGNMSSVSLISLTIPVSEPNNHNNRVCRVNNYSPALSLEDLLSSGSISPVYNKGGRIWKTIREAQDACIWLKSAGFPQYVQQFEGGEFPINVTAMQVEKDHQFLDLPSIEALIKRLNVLNRCADLLEEVLSKDDDSDDDDTMRALSEQWQFERTDKRWSRKGKHPKRTSPLTINNTHYPSPAASVDIIEPPLMVSELSTSPTRTTNRSIKTYSFCGDKEGVSIQIVPLPSVSDEDETKQSDAGSEKLDLLSPMKERVRDKDEDDDEGKIGELGRLGSFASGMLSMFDDSMSKLRRPTLNSDLSRSLPDVFSCSTLPSSNNETTQTCLSDLTGSVDSILNLEKGEEEEFEDLLESPAVHSRGPSETLMCNSSGTWGGPSPEASYTEEEENVCVEGSHKRIGRQSTFDSNDSSSYMEHVEVTTTGTLTRSSIVSSPTQPSSAKSKWHSFKRQHSFRHAFKPLRTLIPIEELSVGQISVLRKLSLVKLTALIELHNGKANVSRILKSRRNKNYSLRANRIFGSSLSSNVIYYGQALPPIILQAMEHLKKTAMETTGIFRRTAAKARVELLKELIENSPDLIDFSEYTSYEVADLLKLYFRELPESLIPAKLSEALLVSYECIPSAVRLQAQQAVMLLLPDENREALQCMLKLLAYTSQYSHTHQMDAQNLSLCLSPTLFSLSAIARPSPVIRRGSMRRPNSVVSTTTPQSPSPLGGGASKELNDHIVSSRCLAELILNHESLFKVAADMMQLCKFSHLEFGDPVPFQELGLDKSGVGDYRYYIENCMSTLAKEQRRRYRGWVHCDLMKGVSLAYCKIEDGVPLRLWRGTVEVPASSEMVLRKLWEERFLWDGSVLKGRRVSKLDENTEIFQYVTSSMAPLSDRDHCIMRSWRFDPSNDSYVVISTSVSHPSATLLSGVRCTELAMRYIIEPAGNKNSILTLFCRVDMRGRSADYYNHFYGRYLASSIYKLRDSFRRSLETDYIETPV